MSEITVGREFDWSDKIEADAKEYQQLPEGDYDFTVESFERGRHSGSEKIPACNKAILRIRIKTAEADVLITHNLFLHSNVEWRLSEFFSSIGQKKKGEPLTMNWNDVPCSTGRCQVTLDPDRNDPNKKYNHIRKFYQKEPKGFKAGEF